MLRTRQAKELLRKYSHKCGFTNLLLGSWSSLLISPSKGVSCATSAIFVYQPRAPADQVTQYENLGSLGAKGTIRHLPPHIQNSLRCLDASAPRYVGKPPNMDMSHGCPRQQKLSSSVWGVGPSHVAAIGGYFGALRSFAYMGRQRPATSLGTTGGIQ